VSVLVPFSNKCEYLYCFIFPECIREIVRHVFIKFVVGESDSLYEMVTLSRMFSLSESNNASHPFSVILFLEENGDIYTIGVS